MTRGLVLGIGVAAAVVCAPAVAAAAPDRDALATPNPPAATVRADLENLTLSGYFGGVLLRDTLSEAPGRHGRTVTTAHWRA